MKCPTCAQTAGQHDRACWQEQVATLKSALDHCLANIDMFGVEHGLLPDPLLHARSYAVKNLEIVAKRENRTPRQLGIEE